MTQHTHNFIKSRSGAIMTCACGQFRFTPEYLAKQGGPIVAVDAKFVIYSPSEGFWNNENGWTDRADGATQFTQDEMTSLQLPMATPDAKWVQNRS